VKNHNLKLKIDLKILSAILGFKKHLTNCNVRHILLIENENHFQLGEKMREPNWWRHRFRGCGYRLTFPRQTILEFLNKTSKHLSAKEIYSAIHKIYPTIGLATIYRTLDLLVQMGLLKKFDFGDGQSRYELASGIKKNHHHLVCIKCGKIIDYDDFVKEEIELVKKMEEALSKKYNFDIKDHKIQFYGVCDKCK